MIDNHKVACVQLTVKESGGIKYFLVYKYLIISNLLF
jgi:hypothetical protein